MNRLPSLAVAAAGLLLSFCSPAAAPDPVNGSEAGGGTGGLRFDAGSPDSPDARLPCWAGGDDDDMDNDGFTPSEGDCNDCEPNVGPNSIEAPTRPGREAVDEDCDGDIDEDDATVCDDGLALDDSDPLVAVRALELCKPSSGAKDWGVVSARWVMPDGSPAPSSPDGAARYHTGHGLLPDFGPNVALRKGQRMLALSSGTARRPTDPGYESPRGSGKGYVAAPPLGFPKEAPSCPGVVTGEPHDAAALEVELRAPSNARGISFDFDFYTFEWPEFICSKFDDLFVALLEPAPAGQSDANIAFDIQGNPVSVNNSLLRACGCEGNPPAPCVVQGKSYACELGDVELLGTGFGFDHDEQGHAATGWLRTTAPIEPGGTITLRFVVYDSGDGVLDSTALVDDFQWVLEPGTKVGTGPVPPR